MKTRVAIPIFISILLFSCAPEISTQESMTDVLKVTTEVGNTEVSATQYSPVTEEILNRVNSAHYDIGSWISLGSPSYGITKIISAKHTKIWVELSDGTLFTNTIDFGCGTDIICWTWSPTTSTPENNEMLTRGTDCTTLNPSYPVINPNGVMRECVYSQSIGIDMISEFYFALMSDGTILFFDNTPLFVPPQ